MEVCIDSVESAVNAQAGGAMRVELCAGLVEGGTTPSIGMFQAVKSRITIPVFVMIRPRAGDFLYSEDEVKVMRNDIDMFKAHGADGFVLGCLNTDGTVDKDLCTELVGRCRPASVTFHRAIDMTPDITSSIEDVISCGFDRVLTSGGRPSALEGIPVLKTLIQQTRGRIIVVPGGGINDFNLPTILQTCNATEFHGSARSSKDSEMKFRNYGISMGSSISFPEYSSKVTDSQKVKTLISLSTDYKNK